MAKIYHVSGKPLDIIKREAKDLRKEDGITLAEAQAKVASNYGQASWQKLMESAVEYDDILAGQEGYLLLARHVGKDEILFDLTGLADMLEDGEFSGDEMPALYAHKYLDHLGEGGVSWRICIVGAAENDESAQGDLKHLLRNRSGADPDDCVLAIEAAAEGRPGQLIELMGKMGVFDIDPNEDILEAEFEALLELEMRKKGLILGERTLFNTPDSPKLKDLIDWQRRVFAHSLSDGSVLISNGKDTRDELEWKIIDRDGYRVLVAEMEAELGDRAYTTQAGEIWVHEKVLGKSSTPEMAM